MTKNVSGVIKKAGLRSRLNQNSGRWLSDFNESDDSAASGQSTGKATINDSCQPSGVTLSPEVSSGNATSAASSFPRRTIRASSGEP